MIVTFVLIAAANQEEFIRMKYEAAARLRSKLRAWEFFTGDELQLAQRLQNWL
jgi:hypothetical protein